jgi:hypothetical protein
MLSGGSGLSKPKGKELEVSVESRTEIEGDPGSDIEAYILLDQFNWDGKKIENDSDEDQHVEQIKIPANEGKVDSESAKIRLSQAEGQREK